MDGKFSTFFFFFKVENFPSIYSLPLILIQVVGKGGLVLVHFLFFCQKKYVCYQKLVLNVQFHELTLFCRVLYLPLIHLTSIHCANFIHLPCRDTADTLHSISSLVQPQFQKRLDVLLFHEKHLLLLNLTAATRFKRLVQRKGLKIKWYLKETAEGKCSN